MLLEGPLLLKCWNVSYMVTSHRQTPSPSPLDPGGVGSAHEGLQARRVGSELSPLAVKEVPKQQK